MDGKLDELRISSISRTGASLSVDAANGNLANAQLNINADAVWANLFPVKMS